ncbi:MAG: AMP-binding protein [Verrucomicrobia bacterium]|nr:AMP-binding protein [Verrucomicrobiota bacterium]
MILCPVAKWKRECPEALAFPGVTYQEFDRMISRLCGAIPSASLLAFVPEGSLIDVAFFFAAWRMGKTVYPISFRHPETAVLQRIKLTGALLVSPQMGPPIEIDTIDENLLATFIETSSSAKIVCHRFLSLLISARSCALALDLKMGDTYCLNLPLFHISGIATFLRTFVIGATLVFPGDTATHISMVPTQLFRLIEKNEPLPNLKCLLVGGAPIPPALLSKNLPIYCSYGMTETASMVLIKPPGQPITPLPHIQVDRSEEGELLLKGPSLFERYFGKEPITGWFHTGDIVNERLEIVGRKDRQFISGGENIIPEEIEAALLQLPDVIQARVESEADLEFGMRPVAKLYTKKELLIADIHAALESQLPRFKIPKKIIISSEPLPSKQTSLTKIFI